MSFNGQVCAWCTVMVDMSRMVQVPAACASTRVVQCEPLFTFPLTRV
jgi:hypothetical protein